MDTDKAIAQVVVKGLKVNNLFQLATGGWQANVTDGTENSEFGKATTPDEALIAALFAWQHGQTVPRRGSGIQPRFIPETTCSAEELGL